ncbi:MAG: hypothetical protein M1482_11315, partial [Chloroflexi bacterium]|nr:hypothetical protein [Chloroflexota bacterium]
MTRSIPWILLVALVAAATRPLWWLPPPYFVLDDGFGHLFRVFEFDRVIRQGVFYPRWAPDLAYGYGYPVFHYYAPLIYYIAEAFHLFGLALADSIKALMAATVAIAAFGAFAMGRELAQPGDARRASGNLKASAPKGADLSARNSDTHSPSPAEDNAESREESASSRVIATASPRVIATASPRVIARSGLCDEAILRDEGDRTSHLQSDAAIRTLGGEPGAAIARTPTGGVASCLVRTVAFRVARLLRRQTPPPRNDTPATALARSQPAWDFLNDTPATALARSQPAWDLLNDTPATALARSQPAWDFLNDTPATALLEEEEEIVEPVSPDTQ